MNDELNNIKKNFLESKMIEFKDNLLNINYSGRYFARSIAKEFDSYWKNMNYEIAGPVDRSKK